MSEETSFDVPEGEKIAVWRITLYRQPETDPEGCSIGGDHFTAIAADPPGVWKRANNQLARWAESAPVSVSEFEAVRYEILFFDNRTVVGQLGLQRKHQHGIDLAQIILIGLHVYVGTYKPSNFTWAKYSEFLTEQRQRMVQAAGILDNYDFGSEFVPPIRSHDWNVYESLEGGAHQVPAGEPCAITSAMSPSILSFLEGKAG